MTTEIEKVVVNANRAQIQDLLPNPGELQLKLITRGDEAFRGFRPETVRRRQRASIDFAHRRQRQRFEDDKQRGHHMVGELLL